ncbi:hypothetical protein [Chryseobacterium sp. ERMR1:04]|uniref:hypothetical protein n=1 Tax=Chryseobacterium sp. ERMR1:04 TaxID=1705393 RepID=UPI0006CD82F0|nr:hypothetical protein [Chryseobacterium sp. ERMR1:04]KPH13370.1 hypothetical protein AMQ68_13080 [Chryseobacterium sp. ERMR1:04]
MKPLERMNNVEKGKMLADLLPEELPNITLFISKEIERFLKNEDHKKSIWKGTLLTANFWYSLVRNVEKAIKHCSSKLHKNHRWFADQLFDGYNALFTIHCLIEYASTAECNLKLRQGIHFLFSEAKVI